MNQIHCKTCQIPKDPSEYYAHRYECKKCVIEKTKESQKKQHSIGVLEIRCTKCNILKYASFYTIDYKTGLYHKKCTECKFKKGNLKQPDERYLVLSQFVQQLMTTAQPGDLERLKHIFLNL